MHRQSVQKVFMSPPEDSTSIPSDDPLIRGVVEIQSPTDRTIAGLEIKLKTFQSVALIEGKDFHVGTEDSVVFEKTVHLGMGSDEASGSTSNQITSPSLTNNSSVPFEWADDRESRSKVKNESSNPKQPSKNPGIHLSAGGNAFEFSIIIPSSSPPSERSQYGRVLWTLTSTAFGAGRANTSISDQKPIYPVVNRNPEGKPFHLSLNTSDEISPIGSISADISSNNLAVAGSLSFDIRSLNPRKGVSIHLVKVILESNVELESKRKGITHHQRLGILFTKGHIEPSSNGVSKVLEQGKKEDGIVYVDDDKSEIDGERDKGWSVEGLARLPDEKFIRGSSHPSSTTSIRWTHNLLVQVIYSFPNSSSSDLNDPSSNPSGLKVFSIRNQIPLQSCCAAHSSVRLPPYQASDSSSSSSSKSLASKGKEKEKNTLVALLPTDTPWSNDVNTSFRAPRYVNCICGSALQELEPSMTFKRSEAEMLVDRMIQSKIEDYSEDRLNSTPSNRTDYSVSSPSDLVPSLST